MTNDHVEVLTETLRILNAGCYETNGRTVQLQLSKSQMEMSRVLLPDDVMEISNSNPKVRSGDGLHCGCLKADSFAAALELQRLPRWRRGKKPVLVLNFANPVNIGGGVYRGARAQEEDLCRRSSLLRSLENSRANRYYKYNRSLNTHMGSDAMILSPKVEVFRDENYDLMAKTSIVAVVTCAAPMISYGLEGMREKDYQKMFFNRIVRLLNCAAYYGYEDLVLGAWGCGAFGNDAAIVSDLFRNAFYEHIWGEWFAEDLFRNIIFAIRSRNGESYNYREFYDRFGDWNGGNGFK